MCEKYYCCLNNKNCRLNNNAKSRIFKNFYHWIGYIWSRLAFVGKHEVVFLVTSHVDACGTFYSISCHLPRNCSSISVSWRIHCACGTFCSNKSRLLTKNWNYILIFYPFLYYWLIDQFILMIKREKLMGWSKLEVSDSFQLIHVDM